MRDYNKVRYNENFERNYFKDKVFIDSDFKLVLSLIWTLFLYLLLLIPNFVFAIFLFVIGNSNLAKQKLSEIIVGPFKVFSKIVDWFFQAKYTAYLILFLILCFIVQHLFLSTNLNLLNSLMTNPNHFSLGNYHSVLTSIFMHADLIHLGTNLLALLIFGRIVEKQFKSKMLLIFLFGGIFANIVSNYIWTLMADTTPSLGASGAIASLIIFAILLEPLVFTTIFVIPLPIFVVGWFLIFLDITGVSNSLASSTNHFAHIAGYFALAMLFFFVEFKHRRKMVLGLFINVFFLIVISVILMFLGIDFLNINLSFFNN